MPVRKKGKKPGPKSEPTRKPTSKVARQTSKKPKDDAAVVSAQRRTTRGGLRSNSAIGSLEPFQVNPELKLHKPRKSLKNIDQAQASPRYGTPTYDQFGDLRANLTIAFGRESRRADYITSEESSNEEGLQTVDDTDPEEAFNCYWGYLPPLDEEATSIIDAIMAQPEKAKEQLRIGPENKDFPEGLMYRNVIWDQSPARDPHMDHIKGLVLKVSDLEPDEEKKSHEHLWSRDQDQCAGASNEALFQRTIMMNLISRHSIIDYRDDNKQLCLDFSVEETWTCPPMPTRAYSRLGKFLTAPKPDLAVCFRRKALISDQIWYGLPKATRLLACYENAVEIGAQRVFHFFAIEAKKGGLPSDDTVGKRQSLNNASQALHNMYEFFKDAGPKHEQVFFDKVRFFSVGASTEGLTIRIHRATRDVEDQSPLGLIIPEYPLRFEYQNIFTIPKAGFSRNAVFKIFETILIRYGAKELRALITAAAIELMQKLERDPREMMLRQNPFYYRYGQTEIPGSKKNTPRGGRAQSVQSNMGLTSRSSSVANQLAGMMRSGSATPKQSQSQKRKRP
ncbi:hypothetical protein MMC18_007970 [Xylographa bjoerkii]|nr:hypothetical protein [Xylographa bjoerkii]